MFAKEIVRREIKMNEETKVVEVPMLFGVGNLTNDPPEIRRGKTNAGKDYTVLSGKFSVAFNTRINGEDKAVFFPLTAWNKTAENMSKICYKGQKIFVIGRLEKDTYTNKEGKEVTVEKITVERFEALQYREKNQQEGPEKTETYNAPMEDPFLNSGSPIDISDDDLPF